MRITAILIPPYPSHDQVEHTKTERSVLGYVRHPYIVGLKMAFQTADKLFFVLDYCSGGELFFHLGNVRTDFFNAVFDHGRYAWP